LSKLREVVEEQGQPNARAGEVEAIVSSDSSSTAPGASTASDAPWS